MKKFINFRTLFFCFITFALTILFANELISGSLFYILFFIIFFLSISILAIIRKQIKNFILVMLSFILGMGFFLAETNVFKGKEYVGEQVVIGRISNIKDYVGYSKVILTDVKINQKKEQNITALISGEFLQLGDKIEFKTEISTIQLFSLGDFSSYEYKNNSPYFCSITSSDLISTTKTKLKSDEQFRLTVKNILLETLPQDSAYLSFGMLFGDKTYLNEEISDSFRTSGVAHALAVSGLHVGFLITLIAFILKKLKVKNIIKFIISAVVLTFYCYLCDFSPSVIRATIMCLVLLGAGVVGKQYDTLNSLSIAGFIILIFRPLSVFDAGFQLSFMSVLCIALLYKPTNKLLLKTKLPEKISQPLALTLCVQIGILPVMAKYYSSVSLLSVVTNFVCIPIFQIAFMLLIILIIIAIIIPPISAVLLAVHWLSVPIIEITKYISSISGAIINLVALDFAGIICFYIGIFVLSGFVMLKKTTKAIICICLLGFSLFYSCLLSIPVSYHGLNLMHTSDYSSQYSIISYNNQTILIGDFIETDNLYKFLKRARIFQIDYIIPNSQVPNENLVLLSENYNVKKIINYNQNYEVPNLEINYVTAVIDPCVINIKIFGYNIVYVMSKIDVVEAEMINFSYPNINVTINADLNYQRGDYLLYSNKVDISNSKTNYLTNYIIKINNGEMEKIWTVN